MHRAYSLVTITKADNANGERLIYGTATTPQPDRIGDVLEPLGAQFSLPMPLLWQHDHDRPIGEVVSAEVSEKGITITGRIATIAEPGPLQTFLNDVWQHFSAGLVKGWSVGFRPLEDPEPIKGTYGLRFAKWSWLETSAVTIPANADATIRLIKSLDQSYRAAPGASRSRVGDFRVVKTTPPKAMTKTPTATQIASCEATRAAKAARMSELMASAGDTGETLNVDQQTEYDDLDQEIKALDQHLARLRTLDAINRSSAAPISGGNPDDASRSRAPTSTYNVTVKHNLPPTYEFCRAVICKAASWLAAQNGEIRSPVEIAKQWYPDNQRVHQYLQSKAAVLPAVTGVPAWAGVLTEVNNLDNEFIEWLRPRTVIGQFGQNGVPPLREVPFNMRAIAQTSGGNGYWVGEGAPKPMTKFDFAAVVLAPLKVAAISVISDEVARFSKPNAEPLVRDALTAALIERIDKDFIDPASAAITMVRPASITNGLVALTSAGNDAASARTDLANLISAFLAANHNAAGLVLIMPASLALMLGTLTTELGQPAFPTVNGDGGSVFGRRVVVSQYAHFAAVGVGNIVIAANANEIFLADDGSVTVDASRETSIEMSDAPTQNGQQGTGASLVSMWQTNMMALRAERHINWAKRRADAVVYMADVKWGAAAV